MAQESWLRSDDHKKFAAAAMKCQHVGGFCVQDGYCHYGNCFGQAEREWRREQIARLREKAAEFGFDLTPIKGTNT